MRTPWKQEERGRAAELLESGYSYLATGKVLNKEFHGGKVVRTYDSVSHQVRRGMIKLVNRNRKKAVKTTIANMPDFEADRPPSELPPVDELIEERLRKFKYKHASKSYDTVPVKINLDGPIGIAHFGDPHLDDDGTDIGKVLRDAEIVKKTEGLLAGNIGDIQNNWIGRLAHLYGQESMSAQESWQITEYFLRQIPWLYLLSGNHDCWVGEGDPINWIVGDGTYTKHGSRLSLRFPNAKVVTINARHYWRGHSQWNTAHAIAKAAQMGWDDNILVGGHTHVSGYQVIRNPKDGKISHCLQVASYKIHDRFAEEKGMNDKNIFNCPVTIINPYSRTETGLVHVIFDVEEAAEYLTYLREKWKSNA